jgi:outer membrane protein, adhesin transport system
MTLGKHLHDITRCAAWRRLGRMLVLSVAVGSFITPAAATSVRDTVQSALQNSPSIAAAQANRRATRYELLESQGRRLPRVDLDADIGPERIDRPGGLSADVNDRWRLRREAGVSASQILFDGFERINDIYRNASRVDSAAYRVFARAEVLALEAVEAHIDVRRQTKILGIAKTNLASQTAILGRVRAQIAAGKTPGSDATQVLERVAGAEALVERVKRSLLEAEIQYQRVVGLKAQKLAAAGYPEGVPVSRQAAVDQGLAGNPQIAAAEADVQTARFALEQTKADDYPTVSLEGRGLAGADLGGTPGRDRELNARIVVRWNLFDGFIARNKKLEFVERLAQSSAERDERMRAIRAEIERGVVGYQAGRSRLDALRKQASRAGDVVGNYETEYAVGKRSLLDVLNAENIKFNAQIEAASEEAIHIFSAYRVLAAMGRLTDVLGVTVPAEARAGTLEAIKQNPRLDWDQSGRR